MVEESPEAFVNRWRRHTAEVELFARTEGSPMLECRSGDLILQLFERTGPYQSRPGTAHVIINPVIEELSVVSGDEPVAPPQTECLGVSRLRANGTVLERDGRTLVVDAGLPLVVSSFEKLPEAVQAGTNVRLTSIAPVHAFVVADHVSTANRRSDAHDDML